MSTERGKGRGSLSGYFCNIVLSSGIISFAAIITANSVLNLPPLQRQPLFQHWQVMASFISPLPFIPQDPSPRNTPLLNEIWGDTAPQQPKLQPLVNSSNSLVPMPTWHLSVVQSTWATGWWMLSPPSIDHNAFTQMGLCGVWVNKSSSSRVKPLWGLGRGGRVGWDGDGDEECEVCREKGGRWGEGVGIIMQHSPRGGLYRQRYSRLAF